MKTCISASQRHGWQPSCSFLYKLLQHSVLQKAVFWPAKDGLLHGERPSFIFTPMTDLSVSLVLVFLRDVLVLVDFSQRYRPNDVVLLYRA